MKSLDRGRINPEGKLNCETIFSIFNDYYCGHVHGIAQLPLLLLDFYFKCCVVAL